MCNGWIELCITYLSNVELSIKIAQNAIEAEKDEAWLSTLQSAAESHRRYAEKLERGKRPAISACYTAQAAAATAEEKRHEEQPHHDQESMREANKQEQKEKTREREERSKKVRAKKLEEELQERRRKESKRREDE